MAEYGFDKLCHKVFAARDNGVDFLSRNTGVSCGRCGHELVAYYCESRLYMVQCRHCGIKSLVLAGSRKEAAEKICGCAADVVEANSSEKAFVDEWILGNGMTFKQVANLISLYKAGGLPLHPVKVGDKVWFICWDEVVNAWVVDEHPCVIEEVCTKGFFVSYDNDEPIEFDEYVLFDDIVDKCFLSYEEAVAAAVVKAPPEEESEV